MGRKRIYTNEGNTYAERNRENAIRYYYQHREEILARNRAKKKLLERDLSDVLNEWNGQLYPRLQENLPKWLEIGLRHQITINNMISK